MSRDSWQRHTSNVSLPPISQLLDDANYTSASTSGDSSSHSTPYPYGAADARATRFSSYGPVSNRVPHESQSLQNNIQGSRTFTNHASAQSFQYTRPAETGLYATQAGRVPMQQGQHATSSPHNPTSFYSYDSASGNTTSSSIRAHSHLGSNSQPSTSSSPYHKPSEFNPSTRAGPSISPHPHSSFEGIAPSRYPQSQSSSMMRSNNSSMHSAPSRYSAEDRDYDSAADSSNTNSGAMGANSRFNYQCQYCGKTFLRPSALKTHVISHTGDQEFVCPEDDCSRRFGVRSNMLRHVRLVHKKLKHSSGEQLSQDEWETGEGFHEY